MTSWPRAATKRDNEREVAFALVGDEHAQMFGLAAPHDHSDASAESGRREPLY
jgi:hypothetical protein